MSYVSCMASDEQLEELQRVIAALTERVFRLEQQLESDAAALTKKRLLHKAQRIRPRIKTDLESRIGGTWLNRVGIVAVLIGVSYFLKFAFDNEWVGPAPRVLIGLV